ncbi:MAG: heme ABC exporter ATP-binding protein CcmA [Pseudomonadota bacterium]|nr:heme ABC exporter ATP-binding protein CcmA [Pseudomonadota bacterium]
MSLLLKGEGLALVRGDRLLFEGLDLKLDAGEALHVIGPNGSGKSSLIRLVAGLLRPNAGKIERADAALADEGLALDRELPLGRALGLWKGPRLAEAMAAFALDGLAHVPVRLLSTGQAKRARLARALASGAPLWLLDEPLNGLDRNGIEELDAAVAAHLRSGGAVLAASHARLAGEWRSLELGA